MTKNLVEKMRIYLNHSIVFFLCVACIISFLTGADTRITTALIVTVTIFLWATLIVPEYYTALLFIAAVLIFGVANPETALAGFKSKAVWLVFTGMVFGVAIQKHKMGYIIFNRLIGSVRSYTVLIWAIVIFGLALSFVIPSAMGRVVLIAPLVITLCDQLDLSKNAPLRIGISMAAIFGTTLPAFTILTSNVPNIVLLGAMETSYGHGVSYGDYFVLNFPVLGLGVFLLIPILILHLFPVSFARLKMESKPLSWTVKQKWLMILLVTTLVLWSTDNIHGISAAWIGLAVAVLSMTPQIGLISPDTLTRLNFGPWFFVAGAISLGAVVRDSELGLTIWEYLFTESTIAEWPAIFQYGALVLGTMILAIFTTLPASPSVFIPLANSMAENIGWSLDGVIFSQIPSFVFFALPYQAPPVLVGLILLKVPLQLIMKFLAYNFLLGVLVLIPLHYLWGRYLGYFP